MKTLLNNKLTLFFPKLSQNFHLLTNFPLLFNFVLMYFSVNNLVKLAIEAASISNWTEAIKLNNEILGFQKDNVEALNRLGKAYSCLGNLKKSREAYKKVVAIDPYNLIALKNLERISKTDKLPANGASGYHHNGHTNTNPTNNIFLYEPGKTKVIGLLNLSSPVVLATLNFGDKLRINTKRHSANLATQEGIYLGALPDDFAHSLISFIEGGNQYEAYVKFVSPKSLIVVIKEIFRSPKFDNQPSFLNQAFDMD